jgi:hypothetical protein
MVSRAVFGYLPSTLTAPCRGSRCQPRRGGLSANLSLWIRQALVATLTALTLVACSAVSLAYNQADFLVKTYADGYLDLEPDQVARWEPILTREHARHRAEELPYLAAYLEQALNAARVGFDQENLACLMTSLEDIYQRQARSAVNLAAPLLATLTPAQIQFLEERLQEDLREAREEAAEGRGPAGREKRTQRWVETIEDWTGPLDGGQRTLVVEIMSQMPDTRGRFIDYRSRKGADLIALLKAKPGEDRIRAFLSEWLVAFRDLPPDLEQGRRDIRELMTAFLIRLGKRLDKSQREHLEKRLRNLRDDLMKLQKQPRMANLSC